MWNWLKTQARKDREYAESYQAALRRLKAGPIPLGLRLACNHWWQPTKEPGFTVVAQVGNRLTLKPTDGSPLRYCLVADLGVVEHLTPMRYGAVPPCEFWVEREPTNA